MKKYILEGASQSGVQWDGSLYPIAKGETITQLTNRKIRSNLYRVGDYGRIVKISRSLIERYFAELPEEDES